MKNSTLFYRLFLLIALGFFTTTLPAQVAINTSGTSADTNTMLDVTSTNKGVLIPRVDYNQISSINVQGLLVYVTANGPDGNGFYFYESGWKKLLADVPLSISDGGTGTTGPFFANSIVYSNATGTNLTSVNNFVWDNSLGALGVGIPGPITNVHIHEMNNDIIPSLLIDQDNTNSTVGDASMQYAIKSANGIVYSAATGIDEDDSLTFEISNTSTLTGTSYSDINTMQRIHTQPPRDGIIDFNHQSRARAYLGQHNQIIPNAAWVSVEFDRISYDEHGEFTLSTGPGTTCKFTAIENGYYQVNARTEFMVEEQSIPVGQGYVSIAIFKNGVAYAVGNNLQMTLMGSTVGGPEAIELLEKNNAPNVSDVLYLATGDYIEIYVFQTFANPNAILKIRDNTLPPPTPPPGPVSPAVTYVSIHKIS